MSFVKNAAAGAVLGGSVLFTAGLGVANAQPVETTPDGLVNIADDPSGRAHRRGRRHGGGPLCQRP